MADLVRVLVNGQETNVSRAWAVKRKLQVLDDEPTHRGDGTTRRTTRKGGRPMLPRMTLPPAGTGSPNGPSDDQVDYTDPSWTVPKLRAEIEARNDARGDNEPPIEVAQPGNRPDLVGALELDDLAQAEVQATAGTDSASQ